MKTQKGFTLIELLVAISLLAVVSAGLFACFQSGLAAFQKSEDYLMRERDQEVFFIQLNQELRNAVPFSIYPFEGKSDTLRFPARLSRYTPKGTEEGLFLIEYRFKDGVLTRREAKLKKESLKESDLKPEILFEGMSSCRFDFLSVQPKEETLWDPQWSNKPYTGLPRGVRIQLQGRNPGAEKNTHQILIPQGLAQKRL